MLQVSGGRGPVGRSLLPQPGRFDGTCTAALLAGSIVCVACSRSGLETWTTGEGAAYDPPAPGGTGGDGGATHAQGAEPWAPAVRPTAPSLRWIAVNTEDDSGYQQLFAVRLGASDIEDLVRLDTPFLFHNWIAHESCCCPVVVAEDAAQPFATQDRAVSVRVGGQRGEQFVGQPLVVPFSMIVDQELR